MFEWILNYLIYSWIPFVYKGFRCFSSWTEMKIAYVLSINKPFFKRTLFCLYKKNGNAYSVVTGQLFNRCYAILYGCHKRHHSICVLWAFCFDRMMMCSTFPTYLGTTTICLIPILYFVHRRKYRMINNGIVNTRYTRNKYTYIYIYIYIIIINYRINTYCCIIVKIILTIL